MFKEETVVFTLFKTKVRSASQTWDRTHSGCNSRTTRSPSVLLLVSLSHREIAEIATLSRSALNTCQEAGLGPWGLRWVRADCGGPVAPRIRPWKPSCRRRSAPVARPSLRHHRFALPQTRSLTRLALLVPGCFVVLGFPAAPPPSSTCTALWSHAARQRHSGLPRRAAASLWVLIQPRGGPYLAAPPNEATPSEGPPPPCKLRWRKGTKLIHVYIQ